ncbi:MAG: class I SAM-dependent methyltransferase [Candidatus Heimdallarchaeota archaeon]|nr:MAG: class I SAM-dependent methyltransferase [Candidatus Heimdallarchaeota archaeon]
MKLDTLDIMVCPDCKSNFKVEKIFRRNKDRIISGIIGCKCCNYPILDRILMYEKPVPDKHILNTKYLMELLSTGREDAAIALPLEEKKLDKALLYFVYMLKSIGIFKKSLHPLLSLIRYQKKKRYNEYFSKDISFFYLMNRLKPNTWGDYLKHRFSTDSFWTIYPLIPLLRKKNDIILDLGCGAGHGAHVVSKKVSPRKLICVDRDYTLLQIAKRYFARNAEFICQDLNNPLPFRDEIFSSIIMLDSFHYVANRARLANELERVIKLDGVLLIPHLHNALVENISPGFPIEPLTLKKLFQKLSTYTIPENSLLNDFIQKAELDLTKEYQEQIIKNSQAVTMVGTNDNQLFEKYKYLSLHQEKSLQNPIINPIYSLKRENDKIILERKPPNALFIKEYPFSMEFLPRKYIIPAKISNTVVGRKIQKIDYTSNDKKVYDDMIDKFVIIDAPKGYL